MAKEENKKVARTVNMNPGGTQKKENKETVNKMSYEQLEQTANGLFQENCKLREQLEKMYTSYDFRVMSVLIDIVKNPDNFNSEFVFKCSKQLEKAITSLLPDKEDNKEETK